MLRAVLGIFILLHGLVHLWLVTLSMRLVPFKPEMGWSGRSWVFTDLLGDSATRILAAVLLVLSALGFAAGGIGLIAQQGWAQSLLIVTAIVSALSLLFFWDGSFQRIVEKGVIGLLISAAILVVLLLNR